MKHTRELLAKAKEEDLYLSPISPLGIPFNTLKGTTNEALKQKRIQENKAGSSCPKRFLALSKELGPEGICTASKKYQDVKLQELEDQKETLTAAMYENAVNKITDKSCLCVGLANASYLENNVKIKGQAQGVVICPGPNMAYFDHEVSLSKMVRHIYGNDNVMSDTSRPNMFIKELKMYIDYLKNEIDSLSTVITAGQIKKWNLFKTNLLDGIGYYENLFATPVFVKDFMNSKIDLWHQYKSEILNIKIPELELA